MALPSSHCPPHQLMCIPIPQAHNYGCGAFAEGVGRFKVEWPEDWLKVGISAKELVPVVVA